MNYVGLERIYVILIPFCGFGHRHNGELKGKCKFMGSV